MDLVVITEPFVSVIIRMEGRDNSQRQKDHLEELTRTITKVIAVP